MAGHSTANMIQERWHLEAMALRYENSKNILPGEKPSEWARRLALPEEGKR